MNKDSKIKFYSLDNIKVSKSEFNRVLDELTKKDIKILSNKIKNTVDQINDSLINEKIDLKIEEVYNLDNVSELIPKIENIINEILIKKNDIKVSIFSLNKKESKGKINRYESLLEFLNKKKNDILAVNDEYNKITNRKAYETHFSVEEESKEKKNENALDRTINFYTQKIN